MGKSRDLRQELRRSTAEAFRRSEAVPPPSGALDLGDLYYLQASPEPGIEWVVLEIEKAAGDCLLVPADTVGWIGSSDVALADDAVLGPLSLRCGLGLWLDRQHLSDSRQSGRLGVADFEQARARRRQVMDGKVAATAAELDVDFEPDYRDWMRTLASAREAVVEAYGGRLDEAPPAVEEVAAVVPFQPAADRSSLPIPRAGVGWHLLLAASITGILTASFLVGRTFERQNLEERIADLEFQLKEPEVSVPWLPAPFGVRGSEPERLEVPAKARSIGLLVDARDGDRLEIRDLAGEPVWSSEVERLDPRTEVLVVWPASLTPPGDYEVILWRDGEREIEFFLRIVPR